MMLPRIFYYITFAAVMAFSLSAWAQSGGKAPVKAPAAPVKVQSDSMRYYGENRKSVFSGNVVAVSDNFTLTADNVTVTLDKNMDVEKIVCSGNVNFKTDDILSISKDAEIDQASQTAVLSGGVKVWQGENFLEGDRVIMYYIDNRIVVDKGEETRVTIIFKPDDKEKAIEPRSKEPEKVLP